MTCTPATLPDDHALSRSRRKRKGQRARAAAHARREPAPAARRGGHQRAHPWLQEPDCLTCHTDGYTRPGADAVAFNNWTADSGGLYRARKEHTGNVPCIACHNSPHATHPSPTPGGRPRRGAAPAIPEAQRRHRRPGQLRGLPRAGCRADPGDVAAPPHALIARKAREPKRPVAARRRGALVFGCGGQRAGSAKEGGAAQGAGASSPRARAAAPSSALEPRWQLGQGRRA